MALQCLWISEMQLLPWLPRTLHILAVWKYRAHLELSYAHKHPLPFLSCADMRVIMKTIGYPDSGALFKLLGACNCCLLQIQHTEAIQVSRVQSGSPAHIAAGAGLCVWESVAPLNAPWEAIWWEFPTYLSCMPSPRRAPNRTTPNEEDLLAQAL